MAVSSATIRRGPGVTLAGERVVLRRPRWEDYPEWSRLRAQSRAFLTPWEPSWASDELTRAGYRRRLKRYQDETRLGLCAPFFVFRAEDDVLVGGCNLNAIRYGVCQAAALGYWVGAPFQRSGYTREAVRTVMAHAFDDLGLHRIEAACVPSNTPSRTLLSALGFHEEGFARSYLKINGVWRDHVLYAFVQGDVLF